MKRHLGVAVDAFLACALAATAIGSLVTGSVVLGVLVFLLLAFFVAAEVVGRTGSDQAYLRFLLARPFFHGVWLIALAGVIIASHSSYDWVLILPLGVAFLALGTFLLAMYRRSR